MIRALRPFALAVVVFLGIFKSLAQTPVTVAEKLGYPANARLLIIHAQDLGLAHSINQATFKALEKGWVTSGSILVPCPWYPEVVQWVRKHPNADLGVRLDLNASYPLYRWGPVSDQKPGSGLIDAEGYLPTTQVYVAQHATASEVTAEGEAQIQKALRSGINPSHLDNYAKAFIQTPNLFAVYSELGKIHQMPVVFPSRQVMQKGVRTNDVGKYKLGNLEVDIRDYPMDGVFEIFAGYTKKDWLHVYETSLAALPPGVYQLSVHLGFDTEELKAVTGNDPKWGSEWRQNDYDVVSSPEFQQFLKDQKFILVSWKDLERAMPQK